MTNMKRTLLAVMLSGTALAAHATPTLSEGTSTSADITFTQQTGTTNTLNAVPSLKGGVPTADGTVVALGSVQSLYDPEKFEVDLSLTNVHAGTYNGKKVITSTVKGKNDTANALDIALVSDNVSEDAAVDQDAGIVINSTASQSAGYKIVTLAESGGTQTVPADTYTIKTTSYVWTE